MSEVVALPSENPQIQIIFTLAGVIAIFSLIIFFALEMINPNVYVLPDRTIYVMLSIIAALLGFKSLHPYYQQGKGPIYGPEEKE